MLDTKRIRDLRGIAALSRILPIKVEVVPEVVRHYGIWHDEYEAWYKLDGPLFMTDSHAVALFQLEGVSDLGWRVRCIEEWADERQST